MNREFALLLGYLNNQSKVVKDLLKEIEKKLPNTKEETVYLGYQIHNLYCAVEDIFKEVVKTFENKIEDFTKYHRELLRRMILEIPGIRPKLLTKESYNLLDEIRGFRHIFRHAYDYELSSKRLRELREEILQGWEKVDEDLKRFEQFLKENIE
jgi:uncharacterized protein YutE (UPF0331/DUF86 family)